MQRWYVVYTQSNQESRAELNLHRQGFEVWLPLIRRTRRHARRIDTVLTPFFPRYLFVRLALSRQTWRSINGTFGVVHLLCNGDTPLALPEGVVEEMMQKRDESGTIVDTSRRLTVGDAVEVTTGPLADVEGLFQSMSGPERVVLLVNLLGRKVRASLQLKDLAA